MAIQTLYPLPHQVWQLLYENHLGTSHLSEEAPHAGIHIGFHLVQPVACLKEPKGLEIWGTAEVVLHLELRLWRPPELVLAEA